MLDILLPACRHYTNTDITRWEKHKNISSIPQILKMLLKGKIDSGLIYTSNAKNHGNVQNFDEVIGSPDDVWIVFTRRRVSSSGGALHAKTALVQNY